MASAVPDEFMQKRRVLYARGHERQQQAAATALLGEGRLAEALEYLERNRDRDLLARVRAAAVAAGDAFSLQRAAQLLKEEPGADEWRSLAGAAEGSGRYYDAVRAWERAGDPERSEAVRVAHHPEYAPFKPQGK